MKLVGRSKLSREKILRREKQDLQILSRRIKY